MKARLEDLPPDIRDKVLSYCRLEGDDFQIVDVKGLIGFMLEHSKEHPALLSVLQEIAESIKPMIVERFKQTGELPAGVKMVQKTTEQGSNVTKLDVFHGPIERKP